MYISLLIRLFFNAFFYNEILKCLKGPQRFWLILPHTSMLMQTYACPFQHTKRRVSNVHILKSYLGITSELMNRKFSHHILIGSSEWIVSVSMEQQQY